MEKREILTYVDHTLLAQDASLGEIKTLCDDAILYHTASVCIPPAYVQEAREYAQDRMKICTVIGFPNGYHTTETKKFEAQNAIANGADEIDMVIHLGWARDHRYERIKQEIQSLKEVCKDKVLKVIVEACLFDREEKIQLCKAVTEAGADYIKTSTGFAGGGATAEDIRLFAENIGKNVKIKAAGGISSFEDAEEFLRLGADRLGTSRLVKLMKSSGM